MKIIIDNRMPDMCAEVCRRTKRNSPQMTHFIRYEFGSINQTYIKSQIYRKETLRCLKNIQMHINYWRKWPDEGQKEHYMQWHKKGRKKVYDLVVKWHTAKWNGNLRQNYDKIWKNNRKIKILLISKHLKN